MGVLRLDPLHGHLRWRHSNFARGLPREKKRRRRGPLLRWYRKAGAKVARMQFESVPREMVDRPMANVPCYVRRRRATQEIGDVCVLRRGYRSIRPGLTRSRLRQGHAARRNGAVPRSTAVRAHFGGTVDRVRRQQGHVVLQYQPERAGRYYDSRRPHHRGAGDPRVRQCRRREPRQFHVQHQVKVDSIEVESLFEWQEE